MTLEELQEKLLQSEENLQTLTLDNEKYKRDVLDKDNRIKELEEHSQKLFLRITQNVPTHENQKEEKVSIEDYARKIIGG